MISKKDISNYIEALLDISYEAGRAILEVYNSDDLGVENKSDESPLTKADLASNKVICEGLKKMNPNIPIISEEDEASPYEERSKWEYCWIVDPLDGTKEFIKRNGEFTTNVALVKNGEVIAGVVYIPVSNEMYYAIKDQGAYQIIDNEQHKLTVKPYKLTDKNLRVICSRSHLNEATQAFVDQLDAPVLISKGSSLKFLSIAKGEADIYPRLAPTMEWDTCAAQIILEEAGGKVLNGEAEGKVVYNKENLLNPFFLATGNEAY